MTSSRTKASAHPTRSREPDAEPSESTLLRQARRLEALYRESNRGDHCIDLYNEILVVEDHIAMTPASDLSEAAVQLMLVSAFAECLRTSDGDDPVGLLDKMERLARSALSIVVLHAGIDLADYGGERYTPERTNPFRKACRLN